MTENEILELIDLYIDEEATEQQKQLVEHLINNNEKAKTSYHNKLLRKQLVKKSSTYNHIDSREIMMGIDEHIDESIYRKISRNKKEKTLRLWSYVSTIAALILLALLMLLSTNTSIKQDDTSSINYENPFLFEYPSPNFDINYQMVRKHKDDLINNESNLTVNYYERNLSHVYIFSALELNRQSMIYETDMAYSHDLVNKKYPIGNSSINSFISLQSPIYMQ